MLQNGLISKRFRHLEQESSTEAIVPRCSVKNVFLESPQNSQEKACARDK